MVPGRIGKIRELDGLIEDYGDEIEADFQQFYGLDVADVWRGALTSRRTLVLIGQLAYEPRSRYRAKALGDTGYLGWGRAEAILADVYDAIGANSLVTIKAAGGKGKRPSPYPRPTAKEPEALTSPTIEDFPIFQVIALTSN